MTRSPSVPGYELGERLCAVGETLHFKARQLDSGKIVGLTLTSSSGAVGSPGTSPRGPGEPEERLLRFLEEGRQLLGFLHPHVTRIVDVGERNQVGWIARELIEGPSLAAILKSLGSLSVEQTLAIGIQAGAALGALAAEEIVHRDFGGEALLLGRKGVLRVSGFGLNVESSYDRLSEGRAPVSGVDFLSPEQVEGDLPLDGRADVYGLGATLYRCLAGRVPHPGATLFTRLRAIAHDPPPALEGLCPDLPQGVAQAISHLMEWDPDDRPLPCDVAGLLERLALQLGFSTPGWERAALVQLVSGYEESSRQRQPEGLVLRLRGAERTLERRLKPGDTLEVGRTPDAGVTLRYGWISRQHARFECTKAGVILRDLGSANGSTVNRTRVEGTTLLKTGDSLAFGKSRFEVTIRESEQVRPARACPRCGADLPASTESSADAKPELCPQCVELIEVEREAAKNRLQLALEEAHFEVVAPLQSEGGFRRFRVQRRQRTFLAAAIEVGQRSANAFAKASAGALGVKHPNVLPVVDLQARGGTLFVVSRDREGRLLGDQVRQEGPLSAGEVARLGQALGGALDHLLALGLKQTLVHPEHLLLGRSGGATLLDVGLAPGLLEAACPLGAVGAPSFRAPEVKRLSEQTPAALVYSLGATLSFALAGRPSPPSGAMVPRGLAELLSQATSDDPGLRPSTPGALRDALDALLLRGLGAIEDEPEDLPAQTQRMQRDDLFQ